MKPQVLCTFCKLPILSKNDLIVTFYNGAPLGSVHPYHNRCLGNGIHSSPVLFWTELTHRSYIAYATLLSILSYGLATWLYSRYKLLILFLALVWFFSPKIYSYYKFERHLKKLIEKVPALLKTVRSQLTGVPVKVTSPSAITRLKLLAVIK